MPSSRRFGSMRISRTSSGVARKRMLVSIAVHRHRLAGAGRAGDEQVRHRGEIAQERLAVNGLAQRQRQLRRAALVRVRLEQFAQRDDLAVLVGNLDPDGGLAGNAIDEHRLGPHGQRQVVGQAGHLAVLHAGFGLELERRDDRARGGSARRIPRRRTRGTSLRACAPIPSARARRSSARCAARRAASTAGTRSRRACARPAPWSRTRARASARPASAP